MPYVNHFELLCSWTLSQSVWEISKFAENSCPSKKQFHESCKAEWSKWISQQCSSVRKSRMVLTRHKSLLNNRKRCRFGATRIPIWSSVSLISLIKPSVLQNLALPCFEGIDISDKKIMRSLQSHLRINADARTHVALCRSYRFSWLIRVWVWGRVVWNEERSPVSWINGVNNSLWRFSDYAYTDSPHSTGR